MVGFLYDTHANQFFHILKAEMFPVRHLVYLENNSHKSTQQKFLLATCWQILEEYGKICHKQQQLTYIEMCTDL